MRERHHQPTSRKANGLSESPRFVPTTATPSRHVGMGAMDCYRPDMHFAFNLFDSVARGQVDRQHPLLAECAKVLDLGDLDDILMRRRGATLRS